MPFVENEGAHIFFDVEGAGPALLFLHGGGGNASSWYRQIDFFSKSYTCVVIDARGFGRSHPFGPDIGNLELMPRDTFAVIDALEFETTGLVCQSMGAWTGLRMALQKPDRIWGFVGASSPMGIDYPPAVENAFKFIQSLTDSGLGIEDAALSENFRNNKPEEFWLYRHLNLFNVGALRSEELGVPSSTAMRNLFAPEAMIPLTTLAEVKVPTLLISGAQEPLVLASSMRTLSKHFGNASFEVIESSGHSPYFEVPEEFNALVARYLASFQPDGAVD